MRETGAMKKQFWIGLIAGIVLCGMAGGIIGISMVGRKATVEPADLEAYIVNQLKSLKIPEAAPPTDPVATSDENLLQGGEHYNHHCAICHDLEGDADSEFAEAFYPPVANLTSAHVQDYSEGQLKWIVKNGIRFTGMPGWRDIIDETTQWKIVYYMRALADPDKAQRLESTLKERGKWEVEAPAGDHHHDQSEAGKSGDEPHNHEHEVLDEHASEIDPTQKRMHSQDNQTVEHRQEAAKTSYTVLLRSVGPQKIVVIKEVRVVTRLGLADAKDIVDGAPGILIKGVSAEEAERISTRFSGLGAAVEIQ